MKTYNIVASLVIVSTTAATAQTLSSWDMGNGSAGGVGNQLHDCINTNKFTRAKSNPDGVNDNAWSYTTGVTNTSSSASCFYSWGDTYNAKEYVGFSFTAGPLASGQVNELEFSIRGYDADDPDKYRVTAFKNGIQILALSAPGNISTAWAAKSHLQNINFSGNDTIEFRISAYEYGAPLTSSHSRMSLDNVSINGTHICVPEPSSSLLVGLGLFGFVLRRRR